jgi:hypothetical protein
VIVSDYEEINQEYMLNETVGAPYTLCAGACLGGLGKWISKKKYDRSEVLVAVEEGDVDQGEFLNRADWKATRHFHFPRAMRRLSKRAIWLDGNAAPS